jgi:predicted glycosyltransferase
MSLSFLEPLLPWLRPVPRIAFYSHDTMGLGHVRRNLLLADALTRHDATTTVLLISGVHVGAAFPMPRNVDCLTLPALAKDEDEGAYAVRHLGISLMRLTRLRSRAIRAALRSFDPDIAIVDNAPRGALGEVEPALAALKARGRTRLVLGLRDVLDDPDAVVHEWRRCGYHEAISRYYDEVWVYGDPAFYELARECRFPATTTSKLRYVGYLDRQTRDDGRTSDGASELPDDYALCMSGGGQDGSALALAFAEARDCGRPRVVVSGPFLPPSTRQALQSLAKEDGELRVLDFCADPTPLISRAARLVTMGGYNSVCEALVARRPTLVVPREWPRREQAIRAERLRSLNMADVLPWRELSSGALRSWLAAPAATTPSVPVRFTALETVTKLVAELLDGGTAVYAPAARRKGLLAS